MAPAVHLRSAVALAGRFPALSGVDLSVDAGEVVVVVGPNGAGKTSLLRTCAGLLAVTSGEAWVLGHDLRDDRTAVRRRGRAARPRRPALRRADRGRERPVRRPGGRPADRPGRPGPRAARPHRAAAPDHRRPAVGRAAAAGGAGGAGRPRARSCGCSTSRTPGWTPAPGTCWPSSSPRPSPTVRRSSSRRTSRSSPCRWPTGSSPWSAAGSGATERGGRRPPLTAVPSTPARRRSTGAAHVA